MFNLFSYPVHHVHQKEEKESEDGALNSARGGGSSVHGDEIGGMPLVHAVSVCGVTQERLVHRLVGELLLLLGEMEDTEGIILGPVYGGEFPSGVYWSLRLRSYLVD